MLTTAPVHDSATAYGGSASGSTPLPIIIGVVVVIVIPAVVLFMRRKS